MIITIRYMKNEAEISQRNIKVLDINGETVKAYCYLKYQIRYFKKDNILLGGYIH